MKLFFDEDNGTGIPKAVSLLKAPGLTDIQFPSNDRKFGKWPRGTPDGEWLPWAGRENYLVISQNSRILETPNEFALIEPNNVKIVFIENGHSTAWRVFQVIQSRWSWLADQWSGTGPLVWILALSGRAEPFRLEDGVRRSSRERRLGRATRDASGGPGRPEA